MVLKIGLPGQPDQPHQLHHAPRKPKVASLGAPQSGIRYPNKDMHIMLNMDVAKNENWNYNWFR